MKTTLITNANIVNDGKQFISDVFIKAGKIEKIDSNLSGQNAAIVIDAKGKHLIPGIIDDQVHFREPGLTHKANIYSEAKAAVAGGVTSFMEMPNTVPNALTQKLLEDKYAIASQTALANYSFYMGASNDNLEEVLKTDKSKVCGVKIFMGSSTGNMLVDSSEVLERLFKNVDVLIATHCEDEMTIRNNVQRYKEMYGDDVLTEVHAEIRNEEACFKSSSFAVDLAKKYKTRLHILHITTAEELSLFDNKTPLKEKLITAEVCVHHLWFDKSDYRSLGTKIKCNPSIKESRHKKALLRGLLNNSLDIIATDHAPHTLEEKNQNYWNAPSGLPLVQHPLLMMLEFYKNGEITLEKIVEKMCHAPADCFNVAERGFIKEGYWADLVLLDLNKNYTVQKENIFYKCGWSPLEGHTFGSSITHTLVNGNIVFQNGIFDESNKGQRLLFDRN
ncbi:MAG TPA: dihydroorotase [Cytophagales bacterium]|nr:dihydroorotase [Cytophagales bacterium]